MNYRVRSVSSSRDLQEGSVNRRMETKLSVRVSVLNWP